MVKQTLVSPIPEYYSIIKRNKEQKEQKYWQIQYYHQFCNSYVMTEMRIPFDTKAMIVKIEKGKGN